MSGAVEAVGDIVGGVGDAIGDVVDFAGDVISDLGPVLPIAAAIFTGGAAAGLWGAAGAAGTAAGTTAAGMLSAETASLLAAGFTEAEVAASLAGLGSSAEIASVLTGAGIGAAEAASLANTALSAGDTGAGLFGTNEAAAPWFDASGNLDVDKFLQMTGPGGQYANVIPGGAQGIAGMDTLGSTSWLESAYNTLKAQGLSGTDALKMAKQLGSGLTGSGSGSNLLSGGLSALGGYLSGNATKDAATTAAMAQLDAAKIAAEAAKFKPIGITTRFGQSNFQKDAQGNVIGAGYGLSPDMKAQQDALMTMSNLGLAQYAAAPGMFAPMGVAGQRAMSLGNQYLATDPQAQAQKYMNEQQALLATGRERDMNQMLTGEFNRGTYGLATGGTSTGMGAANPRLEAMLNAQRQQDLGLAAQATQGGMDYAKFGAGMVGTGGDLNRGMFSGQTAAYQPYQTALQGAQYIEGLGQQPLTMGIDIGKQTSNATSGGLLAQGMVNAAQTQQNAAYSPWGTLLMGAGNQVQNYQNQQQQQQQNQQLMNALAWGK